MTDQAPPVSGAVEPAVEPAVASKSKKNFNVELAHDSIDFQAIMNNARFAHWIKNLPFHEHLTRLAPTESVSEAETRCKKAKNTYLRNKQPHPPVFLEYFTPKDDTDGTDHTDDSETLEEGTQKRAPPHCRCHSCVGFRLHVFCHELVVWGAKCHSRNCNEGKACNIFCPGQPASIFEPASLTIWHLEEAEQHGWNIKAVLTGVGFGTGYKRPCRAGFTPEIGMNDLRAQLDKYKLTLHKTTCSEKAPCRSWCFKSAEQLTAGEIRYAKRIFPEWQRRMLVSEGMATAVHQEMLERKERKAEKEKKIRSLLKPNRQWSEAPLELAEFLGVYPPRLHGPTCCPEAPCVSLCVCFPEEASSLSG